MRHGVLYPDIGHQALSHLKAALEVLPIEVQVEDGDVLQCCRHFQPGDSTLNTGWELLLKGLFVRCVLFDGKSKALPHAIHGSGDSLYTHWAVTTGDTVEQDPGMTGVDEFRRFISGFVGGRIRCLEGVGDDVNVALSTN
jgi:hypothetical protein